MLFAPVVSLLVLGQTYRWVDRDGEHYTNDRSTVPKGAKVLKYEPEEPDVSISNVQDDDSSPPLPVLDSSSTTRKKKTDDDDPAATVTLGPLPKTLKPGDAEVLMGAVQQALDSQRLRAFGGLRHTIRIDVIERADDPRLTGAPEWAGGFALSPVQVFLLSPYIGAVGGGRPRRWSEMTIHEVAHAQQMQWSGARFVPRWFIEGYAQYVSGEDPGASSADVAWWAIAKGDGAPLTNAYKSGAHRPVLRGSERADHALMDYGLALEGVRLMVSTRGEACIATLLRAMRDGLEFAAAFKKATGLEIRDFEALLLERLKPLYNERAQ